MKTIWAQSTLDRKMAPVQQHAWRIKQAADLEAATGVPWSCSSQNAKVVFRPWLDMRQTAPDERLSEVVMSGIEAASKTALLGLTDWQKVAAAAGLTLKQTMAGAVVLTRQARVNLHVDRQGRSTFVKARALESK